MARWSESFQKSLRDYAESLMFALVLALVVRFFVVTPYAIATGAMAPSLEPGDFVMAYRLPFGVRLFGLHWGGRLPLRGELISFQCPGEFDRQCIKRVIGLDGDRIEIIDGRFLFNGRLIKMVSDTVPSFGPLIVPPGSVFVLNDDLSILTDSRTIGVIPVDTIEGQVFGIWLSIAWQTKNFLPAVRWKRVFSSVR
jgi:signal peptidase I